MDNLSQSPLEYNVKLSEIPTKFQQYKIVADKETMEKIALYIEVEQVKSFSVDVSVRKEKSSHIIEVKGTVISEIVQKCIVTNDDIVTTITEDIIGYYAEIDKIISIDQVKKEKNIKLGNRESEILDEKYDPEPIINGQLDIGELAIQFLVLGIDQYPRSVDATEAEEKTDTEFDTKKPFAALKNWKNLKSSIEEG